MNGIGDRWGNVVKTGGMCLCGHMPPVVVFVPV